MEKISAACAMEWSIELEKGLRSKKPGRPIEAILEAAPRIEQWSKENDCPMAVLNMFGLVPGEDRLFMNTILLRLADAFRTGDKHTRLSVLKVFVLELRYRRKRGKEYKGILSKQRVFNFQEMLKRVKIVFDFADVYSRALSLRLLGCWADIAKDSAEIRYMVLLGLRSCHTLEVKASLFAAGCISELSEDFASVVLEMVTNMVSSPKISSTIKIAGVRTFAKMGFSSSLSCKAYKTGKKLLLENSQEEFTVEMLRSLSKLASKSMLLISEQVDLLLQFLLRNSPSCVQGMTLSCLNFLFLGGVYRFPFKVTVVATLSHALNNASFSVELQCKTLQMLHKIFQHNLPSLSCVDTSGLVKLVQAVEFAAKSPSRLKRSLALHLLLNIACDSRMKLRTIPGQNGPEHLSSRIILLVVDQLMGLVKLGLPSPSTIFEYRRECKSLLNLVLCLVEEYPTLGVIALDKIRLPIESVVDMCVGDFNAASSPVPDIMGLKGETHASIASNLVLYMFKFVESCTEILDEANSITTEVRQVLKLLVKAIQQISLFNLDMCRTFLYVLHSHVIWAYVESENPKTCDAGKDLGLSHGYSVQHETLIFERTEMMLGSGNWAVYGAGKHAACQGSWFAVAFMYEHLINRVQSDSCNYWLKSLVLFARAESVVLKLHYPKQVSEIWFATCKSALGEVDSPNSIIVLTEAYNGLCSASGMLDRAITLDQNFYFQRWFLALRTKLLETVIEILKFLNSSSFNSQNIANNSWLDGSTEVRLLGPADAHSTALFLSRMSFSLKRLVQQFDLLSTSFMDMDAKSVRLISMLSLSCSLLAFSTGFALYHPDPQSSQKSMFWELENFEMCSRLDLLNDAINRLRHIDDETSTHLKALLPLTGEPNIFHFHSRTIISRAGHVEREISAVYRFAVSGVLHNQDEADGMEDGKISSRVFRPGVQLLSDILTMWMSIPFQAPNYFFQVRPCIGAELFAFSADTNSDEISILPGFNLSLRLCLQLKSVPILFPVKVTKLYCILSCRPSYREPGLDGESKDHVQPNSRVWETDDAMYLNEQLLLYVMEGTKRTGRKLVKYGEDGGFVSSFVSFEPNERVQGFSTCLLDVSAFPVGSYRIKWHSCCIGNEGSYWSLIPLNAGPVFTIKHLQPLT